MEKPKSPNICLYLFIFIFLFPVFLLAQSGVNETIAITTYLPSPNGVFGTLEVRKGIAIGNVTSDIANNLTDGQIYLGESIIFSNLTSDPPTPCREGQIIYNGPEHMLKFCNGTAWVDAAAK
jgi:hypothetical protein